MNSEQDRWVFGGRHYRVTLASTPESLDLELDDLGPDLANGCVALASKPDDSEQITLSTFSADPLPIELVEKFILEARKRLVG